MKVTILTSTPPIKGISKYSVALLEALLRNGVVEVLSFKHMYPELLYPGGTKDPSMKPLKNTKTLNVRDFLTWYNPFGWVYAGLTFKGDVLHVQWWTYVLAPIYTVIMFIAKVRKKKIIVTLHNVKPHEGGLLKNLANKAIVSCGDRFIVHTVAGKRDFVDLYNKSADLVEVIPHGILMPDAPLENLTQAQARIELGINETKRVMLFFGIIREYKGLDILIRALAKVRKEIPDAHLVIAGKPWEDWGKYQMLIDRYDLGDAITKKLGFIPEEDIEMYFKAADLVICPYKHFDAQSGVGSLALPFGSAMVVTNTGGLPDLVKDKIAVAQVSDVSDLATKITAVLGDDKLLKKLKSDSRELAKTYSWDTIAKQTIQAYDKLTNKKRRQND